MKFFLAAIFSLVMMQSALADFSLFKVTDGFENPLWVGCPPGNDKLLWVAEQGGRVLMVDLTTGKKLPTPFIDMSKLTARSANERGFFSIAFPPDFASSGRFYANYTDLNGDTRITRLTTDQNNKLSAKPDSEELVLSIKQPFGNHNGGWMSFGPDGMLYIGMGDGGSGNDPNDNARNLNSHLGKMLRLDVSPAKGYRVPKDNPFVDRPDAKPEIWMSGFRNPWRCSFDRKTKDFWIGDVGQNSREEINFVPVGKGAGWNFGWRPREGFIATPTGNVGEEKSAEARDPVYDYPHNNSSLGGFSVTGGFVYRGPVKSLEGHYFFADFQQARLWSFKYENGKSTEFQTWNDKLKVAGIRMISSFGEDSRGNLYLTDHATGLLWRFDP